MKTRTLGISVVALTIVLAIVFGIFWYQISENIKSRAVIGPDGVCIHDEGDVCPYQELNQFVFPGYLGIVLLVLMLGVGVFLIFKKPEKLTKREFKEIGGLSGEEKTIFDLIKGAEGTIFQSDLVEKSGFSKVKVTRILDKLEGRGIIERKRRGMTNVVILKN